MKFFAATLALASISAVAMASSFQECQYWIEDVDSEGNDNKCPEGFRYNELADEVRIKPHGVSWSTFDPKVLCCTPKQCHDMIPADEPCKNGYKTGEDGCELPECRPKKCGQTKPQMEYEMYCQWGFKLGEDGCEIGECREEPDTEWLKCNEHTNQNVCEDKYNDDIVKGKRCTRWFNDAETNKKCASAWCCRRH